MTAVTTTTNRPQRTTRWLLVLFLVGICSRGYGYYNQDFKASPQIWMDVVHGTASAPEQYRIGVVLPAYWLSQHLHLRLSQVFGLVDLLSSVAAVLLLYGLLVRTRVYSQASVDSQWFGSAAFLALTLYLMDWINWYQKATTLPTTLLVAAMLWLWTPKSRDARGRPELYTSGCGADDLLGYLCSKRNPLEPAPFIAARTGAACQSISRTHGDCHAGLPY
jgi:hypothetical protein